MSAGASFISGEACLKRVMFWAVLLLPALLITFFVAVFVVEIIRLKGVSNDDLSASLNAYLAEKDPTTFPPPKSFNDLTGAEDSIFLFGESSVVITDNQVFGQYLEKGLSAQNGNIKVINFGIPGIDSYSIKLRLDQALYFAKAKPKAILLYYGHNDYNVAYKNIVHRHYGESFNTFLKVSYYLSGREFKFPDQKHVFGTDQYNEFYWYGVFTRPAFFNLAQKLHVFKVDNEKFREYDARILEQFKENTQEILDTAESNGVPVIFVTPIGNLHAKPYGAIEAVERNYRLGLSTEDYRKSVDYLTLAKDNEIFTGDIRAKSILLDYLRTLDNGKTVFVFDLERDFIDERFRFDETNFLDYFHFKDQGHRKIGEYIFKKINSDQRLREILKLKEP